MGEMAPWWLTIAGAIVTTLTGVIAKLWSDSRQELATLRADNAQLRHELAEANGAIVRLQVEATERGDQHQREHVRDLRRFAGLSTSMDPPPLSPWPPVVVREAGPKPRARPKKS
jgi:hypothetical protein